MADFSTAHAPVAVWEGGYGNHPADRGGETLCGIARGCHPDLALWPLPGTCARSPGSSNR